MNLHLGGLFDPQRGLDLVTAFAGTVIALFVRPPVGRWEAIGIVITGLIVAYFGTAYFATFLPRGDGVRGVAGLVLGAFAFAVADRMMWIVKRWRPPWFGRQGADDV